MVCLKGPDDYPKTSPHNLATLCVVLKHVLVDIGVNNFATYTKPAPISVSCFNHPQQYTVIHGVHPVRMAN